MENIGRPLQPETVLEGMLVRNLKKYMLRVSVL